MATSSILRSFSPINHSFVSVYRKHLKLSRGEICVANFTHPCEWCESRQLFVQKWLFWAKTGKMGAIKAALAPKPADFFVEVMIFEQVGDVVKKDRQTDIYSLTPYTGGNCTKPQKLDINDVKEVRGIRFSDLVTLVHIALGKGGPNFFLRKFISL